MTFIAAKNYTRSQRGIGDISLVVVHTAECGEHDKAAENVAAWGAGANAPKASWHYMVDNDSITQSVQEHDIAWHAGPVNGYSIGVEHAGYARQNPAEWADAYSIAMLERSAELVAGICTRYGIPVERLTADDLKRGKRLGICGHVDVTNGLTRGKGHTDPGRHFPWPWYLERVASYVAKQLAPVGLPEITLNGETCDWVRVGPFLVAPRYIAPVSMGEAERIAAECGCELPTPDLVDAIWRAADLKLEPIPMSPNRGDNAAQFAAHAAAVEKAIGGRPFRLLAGSHKDVVRIAGIPYVYGWHRLDGRAIQPSFAGHARAYIDYSQGLRLVRRA